MSMLGLELPTFREIELAKKQKEIEEQKRRAISKRTYGGAKVNRLTADWVTYPTSGNRELRSSLRTLRGRSRQLARDDDYIKKFLSMCKSNVVGPKGIQLQVRAKDGNEIDRIMEKIIESAFAEWSHKENCSASQKLSWLDCQRLFIRTLARDGEVLVQKVYADNPFEFALKFISADWLDETYNEVRPNGNRVIMSVEVDDNEKAVAYWLTPPASDYPYDQTAKLKYRTRYDAKDFLHVFLLNEDEVQTRGAPWAHSAMYRLKMLNGYQEAEVVASRVEACKSVYFIPPSENELAGDIDEEGNRVRYEDEVSPGQQTELPPGYDVKTFDPTHPAANHGDFVKAVLRGIAAGLDVSYFSLAQDLESVNYSSARIGLLEERDVWRALQAFMIEHFCRPVYKEWLKSAMLTGAVTISMRDYEKIKEPFFRARGWAWVDPLKDTTANIDQINSSLTTHTDVLAEQGIEFEDLLETKKRERELAAQYGVELNATQSPKVFKEGE